MDSKLDYIVDNDSGTIYKIINKLEYKIIDHCYYSGLTIKSIHPSSDAIGFIDLSSLEAKCLTKDELKYRPLNDTERVLYAN